MQKQIEAKEITMKASHLLVAMACLLAGCGSEPSRTTGNPITDQQLCHFRYGTSTIEEVSQLLGPPSTSGTSSSITFLLYQHHDGPTVGESVTFTFEGGYLSDVSRTATRTAQVAAVPQCLKYQDRAGAP
jgi:outer membrane protein assembly factor BamE (lipoprotein component of BamABCDE complex)